MKSYYRLIIIGCCLLFGTTHAQQKPASVDEILKEATQQAAKEKRTCLSFFMHPGVAGATRWTAH